MLKPLGVLNASKYTGLLDVHRFHSSALNAAAVTPALYCHTLCKLLSQRSMVASATLSRYSDTLCLARRAVAQALHTCAAAAAAGSTGGSSLDAVWDDEPHAALQLPLTSSSGDSGSIADTVQCAVPVTLLRAAVALLSLDSSSSDTNTTTTATTAASTTAAITAAITTAAVTEAVAHVDPDVQRLLYLCFPGWTDSGGLHPAGLASAQLLLQTTSSSSSTSSSSAVIDAGSWVLLGQSRSAVCSELAAQHMPAALLPRLLLAAGLCSACVNSAVARLNVVSGGDAIAAGAAYKEVRHCTTYT
jgi:hypothetical protein